MYIMDPNQYAIELVTYLFVLIVYFYELIVYMLLERNAFDSIAFFPQCNSAMSCVYTRARARASVCGYICESYYICNLNVLGGHTLNYSIIYILKYIFAQ